MLQRGQLVAHPAYPAQQTAAGRRRGVRIDPVALRRAREKAGLTLAQVAEPELSRQTLHQMETGKIRPSIESLKVIAERLGRPVSSFLVAPPDDDKPASLEGRVRRLEELCQRHEYELALRLAERILRSATPRSVEGFAHYFAGLALHNLERFPEAFVTDRAETSICDREKSSSRIARKPAFVEGAIDPSRFYLPVGRRRLASLSR